MSLPHSWPFRGQFGTNETDHHQCPLVIKVLLRFWGGWPSLIASLKLAIASHHWFQLADFCIFYWLNVTPNQDLVFGPTDSSFANKTEKRVITCRGSDWPRGQVCVLRNNHRRFTSGTMTCWTFFKGERRRGTVGEDFWRSWKLVFEKSSPSYMSLAGKGSDENIGHIDYLCAVAKTWVVFPLKGDGHQSIHISIFRMPIMAWMTISHISYWCLDIQPTIYPLYIYIYIHMYIPLLLVKSTVTLWSFNITMENYHRNSEFVPLKMGGSFQFLPGNLTCWFHQWMTGMTFGAPEPFSRWSWAMLSSSSTRLRVDLPRLASWWCGDFMKLEPPLTGKWW